jgi:hypothetical protein
VPNPVQRLKVELMSEGLTVSSHACASFAGRPLALDDYATTSGITLVLGQDVWAVTRRYVLDCSHR